MADNRSKRPLPTVMDVGTFRERFGTDEGCWEHLRRTRWGPNLERFICPDCGHARGWWLANRRLVECSECYRQTSVTAGTVFHGARVPLWLEASLFDRLVVAALDSKAVTYNELTTGAT